MKTWLSIIVFFLAAIPLAAEDKTPPDKPASEKPAAKKPFNPLDEDLKQSIGEGEDVGAPEDPLVRIGERMRTSEQRIGQGRTDDDTQQLQQQIVADIDRLIQQVQQQKKNPSSSKSNNRRNAQQQPQREPQQAGQPSGSPKNTAARDSTDKMRQDELLKAQMADLKKSLEHLWGDLPERARDEALQSLGDSFLPKYDLQIRKYFQRLNDEDGKKE